MHSNGDLTIVSSKSSNHIKTVLSVKLGDIHSTPSSLTFQASHWVPLTEFHLCGLLHMQLNVFFFSFE